jgi:hypothetical protein
MNRRHWDHSCTFYLPILTKEKTCSVPFADLVDALKNKIMNCWIQPSNMYICCTGHYFSWEQCRTSQDHRHIGFYVWVEFDSPYQPIGSWISIPGSWLLPMLDWSKISFHSSWDISWKPNLEQWTIRTEMVVCHTETHGLWKFYVHT